MKDVDYCDSYCEHGGVCELDTGHDGQHDSRYCKWTDAEALDKADADAIFLGKAAKVGLSASTTDILTNPNVTLS